jgi:LmbE family N-acetylglucosaminyl deacetylase
MDDEVLGCGGLLSNGSGQQHVHFLTSLHPVAQEASRIECELVSETNGHTISYDHFPTNHLHTLPITKLISTMEAVINRVCPETVLLPFPDYNQDHRTVYEAGLTACRPHDQNHYVDNVLLYEMPCTHQGGYAKPFRADVFLPINVEAKVALYELYTSQVRSHRSCDAVRHIAGFRGMQSRKQFAEAFQVVRVTL